MDREHRSMRGAALAVLAGASLALGACAGDRAEQGGKVASSPRPAPVQAAGPLRGEPAVWHLRAGLNVAALSCRKTRGLESDYKKVLARHRELLKASYAEEQRRSGRRFDAEQTRLYNRFSNQRSREKFCSTAAGIAQEASGMESARLAPQARGLLARLERGLL